MSRSTPHLIARLPPAPQVELDIRNVGGDAFKPEAYGPLITIKREMHLIKATGAISSIMHLINATTKKEVAVSKRKVGMEDFAELTKLREKLCLEIDNPMSIMDQDTSKRFITGEPKDLYDNFVRATWLKKNYISLRETSEKLAEMKKRIGSGDDDVKDAKERKALAESMWAKVEGLAALLKAATDAKDDVYWAELHDDAIVGDGHTDALMRHQASGDKFDSTRDVLLSKLKDAEAEREAKE